MTINTKFNTNDKVFIIDFENKCLKQGYVDSVNVNVSTDGKKNDIYISYTIGNTKIPERLLFATADEACMSLKSEIRNIS
jgi:hypothetical protein